MDPASTAQAGELGDQGRRDYFVVFATHFHLGESGSAVSPG